MCTVPAHVTSGSALIDAWSTPIMSAYHLYSSAWTSVPANPPLAPLSINDPMELDMACEHQQAT